MPPRIVARRRFPTQARSTATLRAIREATLKILEQEGAARLTTNHIAEVAGVSVGSLYQYYADKYAIAADLCKQILLDDLDDVGRIVDRSVAVAGESVEATLRFIVEETVARHRKLYRQLKEFYLDIHWRFDFEDFVREAFPQHRLCSEWLPAALLKPHADEIAIEDHEYAARLLMNMIEGTIRQTLCRHPEMILEDRFVGQIVALCVCYLTRPSKI